MKVCCLLALALLGACNKENVSTVKKQVEGSYFGTITSYKSQNVPIDSYDGFVTVRVNDANNLQIHYADDKLDTTFSMAYYRNADSLNLCCKGAAFKQAYGHEMGAGHHGEMMSDKRKHETDWQHHLRDEHQKGDAHFGAFNTKNNSLTCGWTSNKTSYRFIGKK